MKVFILISASLSLLLILNSPMAVASFNLNVKINQLIGNQIVEVNKTIQADFDKEIIIGPDGSKNKIVLNLKKINQVFIDGNSINPIQVDIKLVNKMKKIIGHPQTVTSFYNHSAQFAVQSSGVVSDPADINVLLKFDETNVSVNSNVNFHSN